jgi:hypothetical protein
LGFSLSQYWTTSPAGGFSRAVFVERPAIAQAVVTERRGEGPSFHRRHLADRRQVVENPERPAVGRDHQVVVLHPQIVDGHGGEVRFQRFPGRTVVARQHHAALGANVEEAAPLRVFAHCVQVHVRGQPRGEALPRLPVVRRLVQVRAHVVEAVRVHDHVGGAGVETRRLDEVHRPEGGNAADVGGDVRPGAPPSRETWTRPSSLPTQRRPFVRGDSATAKIVQ